MRQDDGVFRRSGFHPQIREGFVSSEGGRLSLERGGRLKIDCIRFEHETKKKGKRHSTQLNLFSASPNPK